MIFRVLVTLAVVAGIGCNRTPEPPPNIATRPKAAPAKAAMTPEFWQDWSDGQAEVSGYELTYPRYGKPRKGVAVAIFVTEPFSNSARVKADPGKHGPSDEFPVMKLNLVKKYQTGVYDYSDMLSVFVSLAAVNDRPAGVPTKISFSSQEWCGHVYSQALIGPKLAHVTMHSYFDGEGDQRVQLRYLGNTVSEDALMLWARRMAVPQVQPGRPHAGGAMLSFETVRGQHVPLEIHDITLSVAPKSTKIRVPAGEFETDVYSATTDNLTRTYYVEKVRPHRIVRWETSAGERAEMLASDRLKYWELNGEGGEAALSRLGLPALGWRIR